MDHIKYNPTVETFTCIKTGLYWSVPLQNMQNIEDFHILFIIISWKIVATYFNSVVFSDSIIDLCLKDIFNLTKQF